MKTKTRGVRNVVGQGTERLQI